MANLVENNTKSTLDKSIGLSLDGIEIYSPSLFNESIYYGQIENVNVLNSGEGYDVINPPEIELVNTLGLGQGAKLHGNLKGTLNDILIISPGVGYKNKPILSLKGGNIKGSVKLETNLIKKIIKSEFSVDNVGVGSTTITFLTNHNFETGDEVVYITNNTPSVVGLTTNSSYYARYVNQNTISLYKNNNDALLNANVINGLTTVVGINSGTQYFWSKDYKNVIDKVYIEDNNAELYNTSIVIESNQYPNIEGKNGINTESHYIYAKNHNFKEKDLVVYEVTGTNISGISTLNQYYITVLDSNRFKLSDAGTSSTPTDLNYQNKQYISFNSVGVGTHVFKYPPITIDVSIVAESSISTPPIVKPIVLGSFDSVFIREGGVGYGLSDVVNTKILPEIRVKGQNYFDSDLNNEASLKAVISEGKIVDVIVLKSGKNYQNNIDIVVNGDGKYAKLYPNIVNNKITSVTVISQGSGYTSENTNLIVQRRGKDAKLLPEITKWTIDQYYKNKNKINSDINSNSEDGFIIPSKNIKNTPQFITFYPSKSLRAKLSDTKTKNSPILGWAYDGNPIFGPYIIKNGQVSSIQSGYKFRENLDSLSSLNKRPASNKFEFGSFIEDYQYTPGTSILDENNGAFVSDRDEFPNGTYAYFMTLDENDLPIYPYIIGNNFHNSPNPINYNPNFNQNIDITKENYIKNTSLLYLNSLYSGYDYLNTINDKYKQDIIVKNTLGSRLDGFKIISPGEDYKVGDELILEVKGENEPEPKAKVSRIDGKKITNISLGITTEFQVKFKSKNNKVIGITTLPHSLKNNEFIYITDTQNNIISGSKKIEVNNKLFLMQSSHDSSGITTYISLNDVGDFSIGDYIQIDTEIAKVLEVYPSSSKLFIHRIQNVQSHTSGLSTVSLLPTKFEFIESSINDSLSVDNLRFFNPKTSVGLGTTGTLIENSNANMNYNVQPKTIYIPNHGYSINQPLVYSIGPGYNGILVSDGPTTTQYRLSQGQTVYAIPYSNDLLGITTVSYGQTTLTFRESSYNTDEFHSLNFIGTSITGKVESFNISFTTESNHELLNNDFIKLDANQDTWDYYVVQYDLNKEYNVYVNNLNTFTINLDDKPEYIKYAENNNLNIENITHTNVRYNTNSFNSTGGINEVKIYYTGNSYKNIPILSQIDTTNGKNALIIPYSNNIGKIDTVERIKDGFDYPSDVTLQPKLSANTICYIGNINKIKSIDVSFGGRRYNTPPYLKVLGRDDIILSLTLKNSIVDGVNIEKNASNLSEPLEVIPINNSNGMDIFDVYPLNSNSNRIKVDINQFPLIYKEYGSPELDFPFKIGDLIFIENCRISEQGKNTYNSTDNNYSFFTVTGINTSLGYIDYSTNNINLVNPEFGTYTIENGYGTVVNKNDMARFSMILEKENYLNGETVKSLDELGNIKFYGQVEPNAGWDEIRNQLRITRSVGILEENDILLGESSRLEGKVLHLNSFTLATKFGPHRDKVVYQDDNYDLNSSSKKIQDSYYYQDFSYSIKSKIPYEVWREPVKSIIHPSGFKEFSELQVLSSPVNNLKVSTLDNLLDFDVKIEAESSIYTKTNFTVCYEDIKINDTTTERVYTGSGNDKWPIAGYGNGYIKGLDLLPYILGKTNSVKTLKIVDSEFNGSYEYVSLGNYSVTFNSAYPTNLGINTSGLEIGDLIGYSDNNEYPYNTRILSVGINSISILNPHKVISGIVTESLEIKRNLNHNKLVGLTTFRLVDTADNPVYVFTGISSNINIEDNSINILHTFQTGQKIRYKNISGSPIQITSTTEVTGGISTNILPEILYVTKESENKFKVSGLSTSKSLDFTSSGTGLHKFITDSPESNTIISIDNIIQTPLHLKSLQVGLSQNVGIGTTVLYVNVGINSISSLDILKLNNEYIKIKSIGITSSNSIEVERAFLGTIEANHTGINTAKVYRGNYRIDEDIIYFTSPPYGPTGLPNLEVSSIFNGRFFSRTFRPSTPNDKNIILDDISEQFVGISSFTLKENGNNVVGLYTNTNSPTSININNNPLIFVNNVPQVSNFDFTITQPNSNKIEFLSGVPNAGKILKVDIQEGFGYMPLVAAAATVSVSAAGTISNVYLTGAGSGYRTTPVVNINSSTGYGAYITANVSYAGTISGLTIVNPGIGYTTSEIPEITIDSPLPYNNLDVVYESPSIGIGTNAKVTLTVENNSSIQKIEVINPGVNYKVGDKLSVVGVKTDVGVGTSFTKLVLTVKEVISDDFTGIYPGQFIQFDDISSDFNSIRTIFDVTANINGQKSTIIFKNILNNSNIENNFFIFINGILQEPIVAYRYLNGRLVFTEAPKEQSTSNILYYQGSINDVELIVPNQSIKAGDTIKFENSELSTLGGEQSNRVVKRLVGSNILDTFSYSEFGIVPFTRPISWTKQKNDRIISGSLISKGRDSQRSKIYPNAKLIWNVNKTDTEIYVDNAYPLFIELDNGIGGTIEENRHINIINESNLVYPNIQVEVSTASSIKNINVIIPGVGYSTTSDVIISLPKIKDPLYNINSISGVSTSSSFNSLVATEIITAVGNNNLIGTSRNLLDWSLSTLSYPTSINIQKITQSNNIYMLACSSGVILKNIEGQTNWEVCGIKTEVIGPLGESLGFINSNYTQTFNDILYNENINSWIAIGDGGKIYKASGFGSTTFVESISQNYNYKSLAYNNDIIIAVGHQGISASTDGRNWYNVSSAPSQSYSSILWDDPNFVVTSNNGIYTSSNNGLSWNKVNGSPVDFKKVKKTNNVYIGITTNGKLYKSLNLYNWLIAFPSLSSTVNDICDFSYNSSNYQVAVGVAGTILYSDVKIHPAILSPNVVNGQINSISILDGGFGYSSNDTPNVIIESLKVQDEKIYSIKAIGDYGKIVGIKTSNTGIGTNSPSIKFELLTDYSSSGYESLNTFGINYSQLSIGDYFLISNSNVNTITGYALTGITTSLGGMANYPNSKVGTATSYLDGIYKVEYVQYPSNPQGIVTVTCHTYPINGGIGINTSGITTNYFGNYSWSKVFDYEDRNLNIPLEFKVNTNNGLIGLSTAPGVYRIPPLVF